MGVEICYVGALQELCHSQSRVPSLSAQYRLLLISTLRKTSQNTNSWLPKFTIYVPAANLLHSFVHCRSSRLPCRLPSVWFNVTRFSVPILRYMWDGHINCFSVRRTSGRSFPPPRWQHSEANNSALEPGSEPYGCCLILAPSVTSGEGRMAMTALIDQNCY